MLDRIRLTQLDGKLPNLALMKLAHWYKAQGDQVYLSHYPQPDMYEGAYDKVYASAIFTKSRPLVDLCRLAYPDAVIAGTGTGDWLTVEEQLGIPEYEHYDYSLYPDYPFSIGFTQRGCRLNCGFCVVPKKEGKPRSVNTVDDIWRGDPHPRKLVLLDNDFFGQDQWRDRIGEIREGGFRVSFNQGINIRMVTPEAAAALASVEYRDDQFERRRLYTAWDNLGQEKVFFRGLSLLEEAGIPAKHLMVYMLIGYAPGETMDQILYRYRRLVDAACKPYPMVYGDNKLLKVFQRWVVGRYHECVPWADFSRSVVHA